MDPKKKSGGVLVTRSGSTGIRSRNLSSRSFGSRILEDRKCRETEHKRIPPRILSDTRREINAENKTAADRPGDL